MREDILVSSRRLKRERIIRRYFKIFAIPFLSAVFLIILANLPWLRIQNIEVNGAEENEKIARDLIEENLSGRVFLLFPADNIFFVNKQDLIQEIKNKFPEIESADLRTNFFSRKIKADIKNRQIFAFTCAEEKCFYLDEKGVLFRQSPVVSGGILLEVIASSTESFGDFHKISFLARKVEENLKEDKLSKIILKDENSFELVFVSGLKIISDSEASPEKILRNLNIVLQSVKDKKKLEYIDLRFGNKAYYKFK